jgi:PBP1b-binding outer membrane lipoprotein LpoB
MIRVYALCLLIALFPPGCCRNENAPVQSANRGARESSLGPTFRPRLESIGRAIVHLAIASRCDR